MGQLQESLTGSQEQTDPHSKELQLLQGHQYREDTELAFLAEGYR